MGKKEGGEIMKKVLIAIISNEKENKIIFADCKDGTIKARERFVIRFDDRKTLKSFLQFFCKAGRDIVRCECLGALPFYADRDYSLNGIEYKVYN